MLPTSISLKTNTDDSQHQEGGEGDDSKVEKIRYEPSKPSQSVLTGSDT